MKTKKIGINNFLLKFRIEIISNRRESTKIAKEYFKDKPLIVAEIGVLEGYNSKDLNNALNIKKFYLIDINILDKARKRNKKGNEIWIEKSSYIAKIPKLDFAYIDGSHKYKDVKKDLEIYWKKIKKKGILAGHDIQSLDISKRNMGI